MRRVTDRCRCRLATGGGFGTRELYSNDEECVFDGKRPLLLNGIEDFVSRPDLLERSVILAHPPIPDHKRQLESDLWEQFEKARPRILGALFDRVSAGLREIPNIDKRNLPRMADACAFAIACEKGMGEETRFLKAFRNNQADSHVSALMDSYVGTLLLTFLDTRGGNWSGQPSELYEALKPMGEKPPKEWPSRTSTLIGKIKRIEPSLLKVHHILVEHERTGKARKIIFMKGENSTETVSSASSASHAAAGFNDANDADDTVDTTFEKFSPDSDDDYERLEREAIQLEGAVA